MRIFKNKILKKIFFNHTTQSFNEYLTQTPNTACCQFLLSFNSSMSLCQADFNNLYLSKQPFHVDLLENGISASCHLMFSSRPFTQVSFLAGPQQAVGGSSESELGVIMLCNCGVRACLPVKIRNAKSFPVFKSKWKTLTSDTGFLTFQLLWGTLELLLKDSLYRTWVPNIVLNPGPALENTENYSSYHILITPGHSA